MTLGPAAIFCAYAERMRGFFKDMFVMFGRVPFAFYVAHFYLLHLLAWRWARCRACRLDQLMTFPPFYPAGVRRLAADGLRGVGAGDRAPVSVLQMGGGRQGAQSKSWWLSYV